MVTIPTIKIVLAGAWFILVLPCFTHIVPDTENATTVDPVVTSHGVVFTKSSSQPPQPCQKTRLHAAKFQPATRSSSCPQRYSYDQPWKSLKMAILWARQCKHLVVSFMFPGFVFVRVCLSLDRNWFSEIVRRDPKEHRFGNALFSSALGVDDFDLKLLAGRF